MKIIKELIDDQFTNKGYDHIRKCARAVVINEKNQVALIKLHGKDIFGDRNYYELPGGGVEENEGLLKAAQREMMEELGVDTILIDEIGEVDDFYNLIKRKNKNYYFLLKVVSYHESHWEENELCLIEKVVWVNIDDAIKMMSSNPEKEVGKLVKERELPVLLMARDMLRRQLAK